MYIGVTAIHIDIPCWIIKHSPKETLQSLKN